VNKAVRSLRIVLRRALREGYLTNCPVIKESFVKAELPARAEVSFDDMGKFLAACEDDAEQHLFFRILMVSGMRSGELSKRTWQDIDLSEVGAISVHGTKTKQRRVVPLDEASRELLTRLWYERGADGGHVFSTQRVETWTCRCRTICDRAGIGSFTPQCLRQSVRPRWRELRKAVSSKDAAKLDYMVGEVLLGHALVGVGERHYDRVDLDELKAAVEVYGARIEKAYQKARRRDTYVTQRSSRGDSGSVRRNVSSASGNNSGKEGRVAERQTQGT